MHEKNTGSKHPADHRNKNGVPTTKSRKNHEGEVVRVRTNMNRVFSSPSR